MLVSLRLLILCHLAVFCDLTCGKCLTHLEEINPKLFFTVKGERCSIVIESSQRISHNITSNLFKILLDEVLGYESVKIVQRNDRFNSTLAFKTLLDYYLHPYIPNPTSSNCPDASVNLEIWVSTVPSADESHQKVNYPRELGTVSTPGRFGWFVAKSSHKSALDSIYWKIFQSRDTASEFDINLRELGIDANEYAVSRRTKKHYCYHPQCENGFYTPDRCKSVDKKIGSCALLLAGDYDTTSFVINDIRAFELYVKVIWVGPNLRNLTNDLATRLKSERLVILSWMPSDVIVSGDFTPVSFPPCKSDNIHSPGCRYEYHRLVKSASLSLKTGAQSAYTAVTDMYLTQSQYLELLRTQVANPTMSHYDIACNWMRANWDTWKHWNQTKQNELKILGIFPLNNNGNAIADAADMAVQAINNNNSVLRDMKLHLMVHNGMCDSNEVINNFIQTILARDDFEKTIGILGPACSDTVEALLVVCQYFRTIAISYSAEGTTFSDRSKYPLFFRTIGDNQNYILVYLNLLKRLGWKRIASLTEAGQKSTQYIPHLIKTLESNNLTFIYNSEIPGKGDTVKGVKSNLEALKAKRARIIVAHVYDATARAVMCAAYQLKMTAAEGYVWFLPQWLKPHWYVSNGDECTTEEIVEALNGYFSIAHAYFAPDDAVMQENITVREWKSRLFNSSKKKYWSDYAGYAYDAVWVFALAFDELYRKDNFAASQIHSENTSKLLRENIQNTDFFGVSGRVKFVSETSRVSVVNILQWVNNKTNIVGSFHPNETIMGSNVGHRFELNVSAIVWLTHDGKQPDDGAETCLLQALADLLNVNCGAAVIVANVMGFSLLGIIVIIAFLITKHRYDKKVQKIQKTQELMKSLGLLSPNISDLDKWEMPRDHLVINRKLGEGAFGTVYGGEAYFGGVGWVAAAVKALKVNSTTEQKLDFLSEAEVMKKLDHKNIVKLLGVCTKQEPVYTVMEFMLYGDLKTFLLARRHLVNNKKLHEEAEEISSKKLTLMALDVARGLSYLAQLKFVHRDIASRNCLINNAKVVKIGDFGMTRSMFENDYYKFSRKGMMPVRWMAPESLAFGIFTPASDIWSYGVLLYEIITFGSFPFRGLSNNQVMEHVKSGNTITIPKGIKPELEFLMKSCWNTEFKKRPQASEIVEFLANHPRLISPCLDVPLSSVVMEDTGQLELNLPNNIRRLSLTLNTRNEESDSGIRHRSVSNDSEPFSGGTAATCFDDSNVLYPNGCMSQNENCPWIPLLNNGSNGGGEGSSRSSSVAAGLGKIITIHRSESCDDCGGSDHRTHQTSL